MEVKAQIEEVMLEKIIASMMDRLMSDPQLEIIKEDLQVGKLMEQTHKELLCKNLLFNSKWGTLILEIQDSGFQVSLKMTWA